MLAILILKNLLNHTVMDVLRLQELSFINNRIRVIAYASLSLSKSEKNFSAFKLEFLELKWSVTNGKFSEYSRNTHFTVLAHNNPLTYALTIAKLDFTGQRQIAALGMYDVNLLYRPELRNADADVVSKYLYLRKTTELNW